MWASKLVKFRDFARHKFITPENARDLKTPADKGLVFRVRVCVCVCVCVRVGLTSPVAKY